MSNILQFPQRNKGRVRKSESFATMGECAINHLGADETNVERLSVHRAESVSDTEVSQLLSAVLSAVCPRRRRQPCANSLSTLRRTTRAPLSRSAFSPPPNSRGPASRWGRSPPSPAPASAGVFVARVWPRSASMGATREAERGRRDSG